MECQFEERGAGEFEFPSRPSTPLAPVDFEILRPHEEEAHRHVDQENLHPSNTANTENATSNRTSESASAGPPSNVSTSSSSTTVVECASPGPGPSTLKKRKQLAQDLFDDSPLTDEESEPEELPVKKKHGRAPSKRAFAKARAGHAKA